MLTRSQPGFTQAHVRGLTWPSTSSSGQPASGPQRNEGKRERGKVDLNSELYLYSASLPISRNKALTLEI